MQSAIDSLATTKIWFYNSTSINWTTVYYHAWVVGGSDITNYNEAPAATQEGSTRWWNIELPYDTSEDQIGVIFKNASFGDGWRTNNLYFDTKTLLYVEGYDGGYGNNAYTEITYFKDASLSLY